MKIKVAAHGVKALAQEKRETKLWEWEELINKAEKIALSAEKVKAKKTSGEEIFKELEKLSPFEDEVVKPSKKKRKVTMKKKVSRKQFAKRWEEKGSKKGYVSKAAVNINDGDLGLGDENEALSVEYVSKNFKIFSHLKAA